MKKTATLLVLLLCVRAEAVISTQTVNHAWQRVSQADDIPSLPVHYESDTEPNAWVSFTDDGEYSVHVTRGLMRILNSEAEIAGVLGHEIGHIKLGHYQNLVLSDTVRTILTANLERTDDLAQAVGSMEIDLRESKFSREQETQADEYGVSLLKRTGYDSWGLYNAMKMFDVNGYTTQRSGFNSHPSSSERLEHLARLAGSDELDDIVSALLGR